MKREQVVLHFISIRVVIPGAYPFFVKGSLDYHKKNIISQLVDMYLYGVTLNNKY